MTETMSRSATAATDAELTPDAIMQIGTGFWPAKTLLSAVELGLFHLLSSNPLTASEIATRLELRSPRGTRDLLDGLFALGLLERAGVGEHALYANTPETALFLDPGSPQYMGGVLEMANNMLYRDWAGLTESLRTGKSRTELTAHGGSMFEELYRNPDRLEEFMRGMSGTSAGNFVALAERFDFGPYGSVCDVGGATGQLSLILAERWPHLRCTTFDLPPVEPIARRTIHAAGLEHRVKAVSGDFLVDPLPQADVITMGMILHDWDLEHKVHLIRAAYDALPAGGAFIVIEHLIDDDRRENVFGLMMSLNMLVEFGDAFDYTGAEFAEWCRAVGFREVEVVPLSQVASAGVAYK